MTVIVEAVIDRFEGQYAILLVGDDKRSINVRRDSLPSEVYEGCWLVVELEDDKIINVTIDREKTVTVKQLIADKLAALRRGDQLRN